jgi:hypothetical protein
MFTDELRVTSYGSRVTKRGSRRWLVGSFQLAVFRIWLRPVSAFGSGSAFQNFSVFEAAVVSFSKCQNHPCQKLSLFRLSFPVSAVSFCPRLRLTLFALGLSAVPASRPTVQPLAKACLAEPRLSFFLRPSPSACCLLPSTPSVFILRAARLSSAACSHIRGAQLRHRTTP